MKLFFALLKKEGLIVLRDIHALLALFILPCIFIIIMSYALKDAANSGENLHCLYYISEDNDDDLAQNFQKSMQNLEGFSCEESNQIKQSDIFISIPPKFFENFGNDKNNSLSVELVHTPLLNQTALYLFEALLKEKIILLYTNNEGEYAPPFVSNILKPFIAKIPSSKKIPNSVEQSVPSWIVFSMFFVLIPLSTVFIVEREQGTLQRLKSMRLPTFSFFAAKTFTYNILNLCQGFVLLFVGAYIIPLFGLEALKIGNFAAVFVLLYSLSFAAIGFALLIATLCKSASQAVIVGGLCNILLGAVGGIMVPKYIMPQLMQQISIISPMAWGFDAFSDIILYEASLADIIPEILFLLLFGSIMFIMSLLIFKKGRQ
ncbi:MAG: ABC transporter permease [Campylobacteraceae bacterium]|jgi:ABC-2 type transport system permease protein|nr:ABC transporter permease [Campylobacteraceae bacterium]